VIGPVLVTVPALAIALESVIDPESAIDLVLATGPAAVELPHFQV
jgi:hypothetical protein